MKKRITAFLMCVVIALAGLPVSPLADYMNLAFQAGATELELGRVELSRDELYVYETKTGTLTATAYDTDGNAIAGGITYSWTSSASDVAQVASESGSSSAVVTGVKNGNAVITVTASYGSQEVTDTCNVTVRALISSISFDSSYAILTLRSSAKQLSYTISPSNAGNKDLGWSVSPSGICTVRDGVITPENIGVCTVTAKAQDGSGVSSSIQVIVTAGDTLVTLDKDEITLRAGEATAQLNATCETANGTQYFNAVEWSTSDSSVATVNSKGVVTPKGRGTAIITATSLDGSGSKAYCSVVVAQPVEGVSLPSSAICYVGKTCKPAPVITPSDASETGVTWSSSNGNIATVDKDGTVKGISEGTAVITVTTVDGSFTAECTVKVEIEPESVNIRESTVTNGLHVSEYGTGTSYPLTVEITPSNATNKKIIWTSDNENVATVDENGIVKAIAGGTAVITATTEAGGKKDTCIVTVTQDESSVEISDGPQNFYVGRTYTLEAIILPSTATNKNVSWYSSDEAIVTVNSSGVIQAKKAGTAEITVITANKGKTATLRITVNPKIPVSKITLNESTASLIRTSTDKLYLFEDIEPADASDKAVSWASSNPSVATVDAYGVVTPKAAGITRITATAKDGSGVSAYCTVTVIEPVTGISLNKTTAALEVNQSLNLSASITPSNASNKNIIWSSSKSSVASVSSTGLVTAKGAGTAIITATTEDGGYDVTCTVTVTARVTGIKINSGSLKIPLGEKRTVTATLSPADATNKTIYWKSSNESVATVTSSGTIESKTTGTAEISATSQDGGYKAIIEVSVIRPASSVTLGFSSITLAAGKKKTLEATVKPLTATEKTVTWKSSDTKVATVSSAGVVTAVGAGTAVITCTSTDGYASTTCKVTVTQPTTGIKAEKSKVTVKIGTPYTLKATVTPDTASNKTVVWTTADSKIATVTAEGVVSGVKVGKVKITARTADGLHSAEITVNVEKPVKSVSLNKTSLTINVGKTSVLTATVKPKSASDKEVTWTSSDNDVLKVSSNGKITAKSAGYAVVTCTTKDGNKTAECSVLVKQPVKSVKLNKTKTTLDMNETLKLKASIKPADASNTAVKWTTSNKKIAKVTSSGVVKPVKPGKVTITVTTKDGGLKATCTVNVVREVKSLYVQEEKVIFLGEKEKVMALIEPSNATNQKLKWKSSKKSVATVSSDGTLTPKKTGKTTITVVTDDGGFKGTCKVTVKRALESVKINKSKIKLNAGSSYSLKITKKPKNATEDIIWTTNKRNVAVVNQDGVITAMGRGTATITGITEQGKKLKCKVTVKQLVTGMNISQKTADLYLGESLTLSANVLPANSNNKSFTWSSSDTSVATVNGGKITPKKLGTVKISATSANGKTATCTVTVKQHVSSVALNKTSINLIKGTNFTLVPTVSPANASDKTCTYTSSNTAVATVSASGVITAKAAGTATVTVRTNEGGKTATCTVTVTEKVSSVSLNKTSHTLYTGEKLTLTATVLPATASNKAVIWSSDNSAVATVSGGVVTAVKSGTALITVTTADGKFKATCAVTVRQHVTGVALTGKLTLNRGSEHTLTATVLPSDAYDKTVSWKSSDESVVSVNNGVITAEGIGEATVTVTTADGSYEAVCAVTVNEPITGVELDITEVEELYKGETVTLTPTLYPETDTEYINRDVIWSTSDGSIAAVENGVVTAKGNGEATITVTTVDGSFTATCRVKCFVHAEEIVTDKDVYYIMFGEEATIIADVMPENASNKEITMNVTEGGDLFTLADGKVTAGTAAGKGYIEIVSTESPSVTKTVEINIVPKATEIALDVTSKTLNKGDSFTLTPTVGPEDAYDKGVIWSSSDDTVAKVENGVVTALKAGDAVITAETYDGTAKAECNITVTVLSEEIRLNFTEKSIYIGETAELIAEVLPTDTVNKNISWSSDNKDVATVDENGVVTAVSKGTATITVTSEDTGVTAQAVITVLKHVESISAERMITVTQGDSFSIEVAFNPVDASNQNIIWTVKDTRIVSVDGDGTFTALATGTTAIIAQSEDGGHTAAIIVTVKA